MNEPVPLLRGRWILPIMVLTAFASALVTSLFWTDWWQEGSFGGFFFLFMWQLMSGGVLAGLAIARGMNFRRLFGALPSARGARTLLLIAIPLAGLSLAAIWATYLPLSHVAPQFVESVLMEDWDWLSPSGWGRWAWFAVFVICVAAPVVEEFSFRGLLLTRWSQKWGPKRALVATSLLFGVVHVDVLGASLGGAALAIIYLKTRSLVAPIVVHGAHNALVQLLAWLSPHPETYTLSDFQSEWWIGAIGLAVTLLSLPALRRARLRELDWQPPYLAGAALETRAVSGTSPA